MRKEEQTYCQTQKCCGTLKTPLHCLLINRVKLEKWYHVKDLERSEWTVLLPGENDKTRLTLPWPRNIMMAKDSWTCWGGVSTMAEDCDMIARRLGNIIVKKVERSDGAFPNARSGQSRASS